MLGPTLGGMVTTVLSWEYIFLINVPVGAVAVAAALLVIPGSTPVRIGQPWVLDLPGVVLSSGGLFCLVFPIIEGQRLGWTSPVVVGSFGMALVLLCGFVMVERRAPFPLLDLGLFADRLFAVGNVLRAVLQFVTLGLFFPLVLLLQLGLGFSSLDSAVLLMPLVLAAVVVSPLAGSMSDRVDVRWLAIPGFLSVAGGALALALLVPSTTGPSLLGPLALVGIGLGALEAPTTSATLRDVPPDRAGAASGMSYLTLLLGAELGLAVSAAVLQATFAAELAGGRPGTDAQQVAGTFISGQPSPATGNLLDTGMAFSGAVVAALLVCVAAATAGATIAVDFSPHPPRRIGPVYAGDPGNKGAPNVGSANV